MQTKIIAAFPGMGKTTFFNENPDICLDSDSSKFSWILNPDGTNSQTRNPYFPTNYFIHIRENIGKYEYIFISSHQEVRDILEHHCIFFYFLFPTLDRKEEFLLRYKERGSAPEFIALIDKMWSKWINDSYDYKGMHNNFPCNEKLPFITDALDMINRRLAL